MSGKGFAKLVRFIISQTKLFPGLIVGLYLAVQSTLNLLDAKVIIHFAIINARYFFPPKYQRAFLIIIT